MSHSKLRLFSSHFHFSLTKSLSPSSFKFIDCGEPSSLHQSCTRTRRGEECYPKNRNLIKCKSNVDFASVREFRVYRSFPKSFVDLVRFPISPMGNSKSSSKDYRYLFVGSTRDEKLHVLKEIVNEFSAFQYNKQKLRIEALKIKLYMLICIQVLINVFRKQHSNENDGDSKERTSEFDLAARYLREVDTSKADFDSGKKLDASTREVESILVDPKFPRMLKVVWLNEAIQKICDAEFRTVESVLPEFADFFLNRIEEIYTLGWLPSKFDIACCSQQRRKHFEWKICHKGLNVSCVANLLNTSRISHVVDEELFDFEDEEADFHGFVYLYRLDEFDKTLSTSKNSLESALETFQEMVCRAAVDHRLVVVLTRKNIFEEKLKSGISLQSVYPEYSGEDDYQTAFEFIVNLFEKARDVSVTGNSTQMFVQDLHSESNARPDKKFLFYSIKQGIFENNFDNAGIMKQVEGQ
jgi:hypothetical protein